MGTECGGRGRDESGHMWVTCDLGKRIWERGGKSSGYPRLEADQRKWGWEV